MIRSFPSFDNSRVRGKFRISADMQNVASLCSAPFSISRADVSAALLRVAPRHIVRVMRRNKKPLFLNVK
ncbi:MAG TPA: hypothetical protein DCS28_03160 [Candidatus Moranbacteria bacterium]|nr:hypothetical protein [Candidatus Moranbacteria bacterium]HAT75011.1 hypothetical protein [Candidatus Moranbacteria bacterium]